MEQNRPKQTDQQATNAALAALAAAGNAFALGQLWEVNKGFVRRQLWQWYEKNQTVADSAGLSFEDLVQEGYFAVDYAAKHYSAEQGSFTTYLSYALLKQIRTATRNSGPALNPGRTPKNPPRRAGCNTLDFVPKSVCPCRGLSTANPPQLGVCRHDNARELRLNSGRGVV